MPDEGRNDERLVRKFIPGHGDYMMVRKSITGIPDLDVLERSWLVAKNSIGPEDMEQWGLQNGKILIQHVRKLERVWEAAQEWDAAERQLEAQIAMNYKQQRGAITKLRAALAAVEEK